MSRPLGGDGVAPGAPGMAPAWTSSAKDLVTTALGQSRLWATIGHGIVDEVYTPSTGQPQIRDLGFLVSVGGAWHEVKRVARYTLELPAPTVPVPTIVHQGEDYELTLEVVPDPLRDVLLLRYRLVGDGARLYPLLAPHLGGDGRDNTAWVEAPDLLATGPGRALCLASNVPFLRASAGFVGASDGWQDFRRNGALTWSFDRAEHGNVALIGELEAGEGVLALGFAATLEGARTRARASLAQGFAPIRSACEDGWRAWAATLVEPELEPALRHEALLSATVLKVHEDRAYPGAVVASLSIPWGDARDDLGGYHLVWARDAVEAGLALLTCGQVDDAQRMLAFLAATQRPDGHWYQNVFPDGRGYWTGIQLDEVAFPVLLAARLREEGAEPEGGTIAPMVRRAVRYIARHGPLTQQDRWEENAGANPFTIAVEVAALICAAPWLEGDEAAYAASLADVWNERLEEWTYVADGPLARDHGADGYYVRIAPPASAGGLRGQVDVRNKPGGSVGAAALVSLDFLALARLGLRRPDDPRIGATLAVVDALLRCELPTGVAYHRYNGDGYGEHDDGRPFDGTGVGRAWPLLAGERGELAAQLGEDAAPYLRAMASMAGPGGMLPEQVWDAAPIPARGLDTGRPSGSAMPLVWAHAQFLKLARTLTSGRPVELMRAVEERYGAAVPRAATWHWRQDVPFQAVPGGRDVLIEALDPFELELAAAAGAPAPRRASEPLPFGLHGVRLGAAELAASPRLEAVLVDGGGERRPVAFDIAPDTPGPDTPGPDTPGSATPTGGAPDPAA